MGFFNLGVITNTITILIGSIIGTFFHQFMKEKYENVLFLSIGLTTMIMGIEMGLKASNLLIVLISLALGGLIGEYYSIESKLESIGSKFKSTQEGFTKSFVASTILFTVGPMTIIGSMNAGVDGNNSILFLKSALDGISSIIFASTMGKGVFVSSVSVLVIEGTLVSLGSLLHFLTLPTYLADFTATGGLMILAIGIRMSKIKEIKVGNFLPSLVVVVFADWIAQFIK
jgi:uncharacterized membrane protein YqgA involved in biofilm formation